MTSSYRGPEYIDIVEENISPPDSTHLLSTYVYDYNNNRLRGYQNDKGEISLDMRIGSVATVLTGFYSRSEGVPRSASTPLVLYRYRWTGWPDPSTKTVLDTLITDNSDHYNNVAWSKNYGVEFQLKTRRISRLSTLFRVSASYVRVRRGAEGVYMSSARTVASLGDKTVFPFYHREEAWSQKMIVNWIADWYFKPVGLWTTFYVQQTLFDASIRKDDPILYATAYYDPIAEETVYLTPAESASLGIDRNVDPLDLEVFRKPNDRLLFNINVTKSLGRGAELSMFVHNFFDDAAFYQNQAGLYRSRNHDIFYGVEFSMVLNQLFRTTP